MSQVAERYDTYASGFDALRRSPAFGAPDLRAARESAYARFEATGVPSTRDEEWRFTNVSPIARTSFGRAPEASVEAARLSELAIGSQTQALVAVVNGRVSPANSSLPAGVTLWTIGDAPAAALLPARPGVAGIFVDLNTALFEDLVVLEVAAGVVVPEPVHVLFVSAPGSAPVVVPTRLVIMAGEGAQLSVIESYVDAGPGTAFVNAVVDVRVAPGAIVDHVKVQNQGAESFHLASMFVHLGRASTFASRAITLGGRISRNDIVATLDGEGAECRLDGLYVATGDALVDTHTTIDHAQPHCPSHEVYKGVLAGRARAVFNGKIIVRPDAQKTDAKQTNKALLLTDEAQVNTKPQLEIFADDVKCTHGATVGQLDDDALFYLKARGISAEQARNMLIHAFAGEVLDGVSCQPVRDAVMRIVDEKLNLND